MANIGKLEAKSKKIIETKDIDCEFDNYVINFSDVDITSNGELISINSGKVSDKSILYDTTSEFGLNTNEYNGLKILNISVRYDDKTEYILENIIAAIRSIDKSNYENVEEFTRVLEHRAALQAAIDAGQVTTA